MKKPSHVILAPAIASVKKRSLYCCLEAKVKGDKILCAKEHPLSRFSGGTIGVCRLQRGEPLELTVCQSCKDYLELGPPVEKDDRGWK